VPLGAYGFDSRPQYHFARSLSYTRKRMDQLAWIFWLILGVALIVAEVFTLSFFLLWFGIGAIGAALAAMLGLGFGWQFLVFAVISVGFTLMSRTIFSQYLMHREEDSVKMGMDSLPGQVGTVTISSKGALNEAAVKVFGSEWTAFPSDGVSEFAEGEKVEVVSIKGSSIYVRKAGKELPGWKQD
jgi:membrane protein implicated in regulation of membrane protease activity